MKKPSLPVFSSADDVRPGRRRLLQGAAALAGAGLLPALGTPSAHAANDASVVETTCGKVRGVRNGA